MIQNLMTLTSPPLSATFARVSALSDYLAAEIGPLECGWFRASDLLQPNSPYLEEGLTRSVSDHPGAERRVAGSFFIGHYTWYLAAAAIGCYLAERRAPDLAAENVALRYSTFTWEEDGASGQGERIDVRFLNGRFAALSTDPAADHPEMLLLPDEVALRNWLRLRLEEHLTPVIEMVYSRTRLGKRSQWALVADACAGLFLHAGQALGDGASGCAEGLAFVRTPGSPQYNLQTGYVTLDYQGHCETFRTRGSCCLYYRVGSGEKCTTCILRPEEERNQRLFDYMARKYAQGEG